MSDQDAKSRAAAAVVQQAKDALHKTLKEQETAEKKAKADADAAARKARYEEKEAAFNKAWGDSKNPSDQHHATTVVGKLQSLKGLGGKAYESYQSSMAEMIELLIKIAEARRLRAGFTDYAIDYASRALGLSANLIIGALKLPYQAATGELRRDWADYWGKGMTLPKEIMESATCDNNGKVTFAPLDKYCPAELCGKLESETQGLVKHFLAKNGYHENPANPNVFSKDGTKLNQADFEKLKKEGFEDFLKKEHQTALSENHAIKLGTAPDETPSTPKLR